MRWRGAPANSLAASRAGLPLLDALRLTGQDVPMPDKGPGSKGGAKKPKGGKAAAATKNGKK